LTLATTPSWAMASSVRPLTSSQDGDSGMIFQHAMTGRMSDEAMTARNLQDGRAMATQGTVKEANV